VVPGLAHRLNKGIAMTNRLDTIATRQRQTRVRDRVFVAAVALVTTLGIASVALGASMPVPAAQHAKIAAK
jgi:hypothetical protein